MNKEWVNFPVDIISLLNLEHNDFFDKQIIGFIEQNGISSYKSLNVWDKEFIGKYSIKDPRTFPVKLLHCYLNLSRKAYSRDSILVRAIDKVLKRII